MSTELEQYRNAAGKVTVATLLSLFVVTALALVFDVSSGGHVQSAMATSTATTSVTVLNTPPAWTVTAREQVASATSTPTNSGGTVTWTAVGTDSNGENYYFLVCKASSTPTATPSGAPVCGGGSTNQWVVSGSIVSGNAAVVSTTTADSWVEKSDWYAYICDANAGSPRCNATMYNGLHEAGAASATSSPFVVNHRPTFTAFSDNSSKLPGELVTWSSTATDTDQIRGGDNIQLFVCKAQDFNASIPGCGAGGEWSSSTMAFVANPVANATITIPTQDKNYGAWGYVVDQFNHPALGGSQDSNSVLTVGNAAPYVSSSSIRVYDVYGSTTADTNLSLVTEEGQTNNYVIRFDVNDDNSCQADGGGNEITDADINVFRSGIGAANCDASGNYNVNNCYTDTSPLFAPTCYQVPGDSCTAGDAVVTWECTFPLWYTADPTDGGSQYAAEDWRASSRATDEALTGPYSTDDRVVDAGGTSQMLQFLSFRATGSPIAYGSWEPGDGNPSHTASTTVYATGNTGLDQYLSGDAMCVGYPVACSGLASNTIFVPYQHYSLTDGALYAAGTELSTSTTPVRVDVVIPKTQATSSPSNDATYWAIYVPSSITYAGDYLGRNYIDGVVAPSGEW